MILTWETILDHALSLEGTTPGSHYGKPTVFANGHPLVSPGHEEGSFVLHIDTGTKEMLMGTDPATYWQTPHYEGWPGVLVRYASADPQRVLAMLERSRAWAVQRKPPRKRKKGRSKSPRNRRLHVFAERSRSPKRSAALRNDLKAPPVCRPA
ncbi:MAG TPA: hypothetical protein VG271_10115 [Beijerinckiaceae bacterium]|jgi:hypothetical protein|nr:hypothetical protein [Beijerinckiaceae bacterium]